MNCDDGFTHTAPAGLFAGNDFGLHDMLGNVWEWVEDCWHEDYRGAPANAVAWLDEAGCSRRVLRGGSWDYAPGDLRSAIRFGSYSDYRSNAGGFRVARTLR